MGADRAAHADSARKLQAALATGAGRLTARDQGGCSWRPLPELFGPWHTVYMRGRRWMDKGVLERVFAELHAVVLEDHLQLTLTPGYWGDAPRGRCGCWSSSAPYPVSHNCSPTAPTRDLCSACVGAVGDGQLGTCYP